MDFQNLILEIARILDTLKIPYAITGGYAVSIWGKPRSTFDVDMIIEFPQSKIYVLAEALRKISELSYVDENVMAHAVERKGEFNFIHTESGIKVDFFVLKNDAFSRLKLQRRVAKVIEDKKIYFLSPEDLILSKLLWRKETESELQLRDVESIMKFQKKLDWKYINKWAKIHNTIHTLNTLHKNHA